AVSVLAVLEDGPAFWVVLRVGVGLVPALEAAKALHERMVGLRDDGAKGAGAVAQELRTYQVDVLRRVEEAVRRSVQRDKTAAALDEIEQGLLPFGADARGVGVDDEAVVAGEDVRIQRLHFIGVGQVDAAPGEDRQQLAEAIGGAVMAVVAEEE